MRGRNRKNLGGVATPLRFRCLGNLIICHKLAQSLHALNARNRCRQSCLAMVNVTNRTNVNVRLDLSNFSLAIVFSLFSTLPVSCRRSCCLIIYPTGYLPAKHRSSICLHHDGAHERDRTADLVLTKDVLCRLSYMGIGSASCNTSNAPRVPVPTPLSIARKTADRLPREGSLSTIFPTILYFFFETTPKGTDLSCTKTAHKSAPRSYSHRFGR
jgi:hypothetical protein